MGRTLKLFSSVWRQTKIFILTILFLLIFPIILLLLCPIYILRYFVSKINSVVYAGGGKMLSTKSAVFAADKMYTKPKCPLLVYFLFDGNVELDKVIELVTHGMIQKKNKSGQLIYPQLQQYITTFCGFFVWRWDRAFNLHDHIVNYDGCLKDQILTEELVPVLSNELTIKPFKKGKSPWEGYLITNTKIKTWRNYYSLQQQNGQEAAAASQCQFYKIDVNGKITDNSEQENGDHTTWNFDGEQSAAIFRLHHSLADGISVRIALMDLVGYKMPPTASPRLEAPTSSRMSQKCQKLVKIVSFPFCAPFETIGALLDAHDVNEWHLPEHKLTGELSGASSEPIRVDFIKEIKNLHGVPFAAVVLSAVAGGIRNFMIAENIKVPKRISVLTPLPMSGHSAEKLENHLTAAAIKLPLGKSSAAARLKSVHKNISNLKKSFVPQANYYFYPVLGGLFPFMIRKLFKHNFTTGIMSSFQGPEDKLQFLGMDLDDMVFSAGLLQGQMGLGIALLSYNGVFRILLGVDKSIISSHVDVRRLVHKIHQEFYVLRDLEIV